MSQAESADVVEEGLDAPEGEEVQGSETQHEGAETEGGATDEAAAQAADEVVVSIGEESPPPEEEEFEGKPAPAWVKDLRQRNRELQRENRELKAKATPETKPVDLGKKPTLEGCDFDTERFEKDLEQWHERKRAADAEAESKRKAEEQAQTAWQKKLDAYGKAKAELKVPDFEDAEANVKDALSVVQQSVIVKAIKNNAAMVYALGKNPQKLQELAALQDPIEFTVAVAQLETQLKVTPRKSAPVPERQVRGSTPGAAVASARLTQLHDEARRTGDYTKYLAAKREAKG